MTEKKAQKKAQKVKKAGIKSKTPSNSSRSQKHYDGLIEYYPEAILVHNKGKIVYVNNAAVKLFGAKTDNELIGMPFMELLHPDFYDVVQERIKNIYTFGVYQKALEEKFIKLDGSIIDVEVISLPINYNNQASVQIILRDITTRKIAEQRQNFLEKISKSLFVSFNDRLTLQKVAKLLVPSIADYCRIVVVDKNGDIQEIAVNHKNPNKVHLAKLLYDEYKDNPTTTHGVQNILNSKKPELISRVEDFVSTSDHVDPKIIKTIKKLGLKSYMGVPLLVRNKILGAVILSSVKKNRFYTEDDLLFAQEIARRIALAIDNARHFNDSQAEIETRKRAEERLELAQAIGHIGSFEWDIAKRKFFWSRELEEIFGLRPGTFSQKYRDWEKLVHPEDRERIVKKAKANRDLNKTNEFIYRILRPDGSTRWVYSKSKVILDKKGRPIKRTGMMIDITDQKRVEENLKFLADASKILSSSLDFETTFKNVAKLAVPAITDWCVIDLVNEDGKLESITVAHKNPRMVKWAKKLRSIDPPDLNSNTGVAKVIKSGKSEIYPVITEKLIRDHTKDKKHLKLLLDLHLSSVIITPIFREGKCVGAISFISSDSNRHYDTRDLVMAEELANRASLALENAWLYKKSQEAIALRDEFISVASHELKTPITSVKIFNQIIQKHAFENNDEKASLYLHKMDKQLNKLTELIYNLLNVNIIQAGTMDYNKKHIDINSIVADAVDIMQDGAKHKITVKGSIDRKLLGDEDRLSQVIVNLISNGIKYSPGADKIHIHLKQTPNSAVVCVQDFGIGMSQEHLNKIFERFYRVYDNESRTFPGLGIGLYISNEIIKKHDGKFWVESKPGKGSKFYFAIPFPNTRIISLSN